MKTRRWSAEQRAAQALRIRAIRPWRHARGPATPAGKAVSAQNSRRHGFRSREYRDVCALLRWQARYVACINAFMRSAEFDDIYFSAEDGLAETKHTFLDGNNLPDAWAGKGRFCIAETGFGTGLNMLAVWRLFDETSAPHQRLDLISVEKYPLTREQIREALAPWDFGARLDRLLALYPLRCRGFHRLNLSERVTLTLVFDDVAEALPNLNASVDAWFLDGFAPAKNPGMWNDALYAQMARLSHAGTTLATFTAAGEVRRGLSAAGFDVEKRKGYGRKRDMVVGRYNGGSLLGDPSHGRPTNPVRRVAVVGAGLAGLSAAWHLRREGVDVVVYDAQGIASGASGNAVGIINPKLTAQPSAQSDYYTSAYAYALAHLPVARVGALHLQTDDDKARRFAGYVQNLGWDPAHMVRLDARDASDVAGVALGVPCLHYPDAGYASPKDICAMLADGIDVRIEKIDALPEADAVIIAAGPSVTQFCGVPVGAVRGQTTRLAANDVSARLKCNLSYGGYVTPSVDGAHMCGATFQPWGTSPGVSDDDHARNIASLEASVPDLAGLQAVSGWVGFRAAAKDRFPLVGASGDVYLSAAHGSHGMISGFMAGAVLASAIAGAPSPVGAHSLAALNPARFKGHGQ